MAHACRLTSGAAPPLEHLPQGCSSVLYFEARKHKDLYLWVAKSPSGPSVKFHVTNGELSALVRMSIGNGRGVGRTEQGAEHVGQECTKRPPGE